MERYHYPIITRSNNDPKQRRTINMPALHLSFFGGVHISREGLGEIAFSRRKEIGLLAFLALEAEHAHSRETLMGLFWPELPEEDARNNLRVALARMRTQLDEPKSAISLLSSTRTTVRFQMCEALTFDVASFHELIAESESCTHSSRDTCLICQQRLTQAANLYRGPLLHGFYLDDCPDFDEWLFVRRERLHLQVLDLLDELTQGLEKRQQFPEAVALIRHQLELDPLHDAAQRRLLRLLAFMGQTSAALSQYQSFKTLLNNELGVEPDIEMVRLATQIKDHTLQIPRERILEPLSITHPNNLPENLTPFFGRENELLELGTRLTVPTYRLITLVGPGGVGKTRLSIEAARNNLQHYSDGIFFVPLASVERVDNMAAAIADALRFTLRDGAQSPQQQLIRFLASKNILLLIDNLEHLMDGVDLLLDILRCCPGIMMLITSRQRLDVQAEDVFELNGLPIPTPEQIEQAGQFAAVRLFCDRAHRLSKSFRYTADNSPNVVAICRMVDGVPLAVELAASWIQDFNIVDLAEAISQDIDLLRTTMRDMKPQHRSIRAVFDTSWRLLSPSEQMLLAKLSVFRGGFSDADAVSVADATPIGLTRLGYKSLIRQISQSRYDLHELIRQYAAEKLFATGEVLQTEIQRRHSFTYATLLASQADALWGMKPREITLIIQRDLDNVRLAWEWAVVHHEWELLKIGLSGIYRFMTNSGLLREADYIFEQALGAISLSPSVDATALPTELTLARAWIQAKVGRFRESIEMAKAALDWAIPHNSSNHIAEAYAIWGFAAPQLDSDNHAAIQIHEQGLQWARHGQHMGVVALHLRYMAMSYIRLNQYQQAETNLREALTIQLTLGNIAEQQAIWMYWGGLCHNTADYVTAHAYLEKALALLPQVDNRETEGGIYTFLGAVESGLGNYGAALNFYERALSITKILGEDAQESNILALMASVHRKSGKLAQAETLALHAISLARQFENGEGLNFGRLHLGYVLLDEGHPDKVLPLLATTLPDLAGDPALLVETTAVLVEAHRQLGQLQEARILAESIISKLLVDTMYTSTEEPFNVYLNIYRTLHEIGDVRADILLHMAKQQLRSLTAKIEDVEAQRRFLEDVPAHRELLQ
jgi:predicted ATPase/DNA-binding SARP family transcriptional activator